MSKLDIIIPHYHEPASMLDPMFAMLKLQRNVLMTDFRVMIINDGEECALPEDFGRDMPFDVKVRTIPHSGVSAARNAGLDASQADWVMFCDADDAFLTTTALQTFFKFTVDKKNMVTCAFFEEALSPEDGRMALLWHGGSDYIFVHGKMFRRTWLLENNIRFNNELTLHEDSYFVAMAKYLVGKANYTRIKDPLYLWQYNKASETRKRANFVLETYDHLIKKNTALTEELLRRGMFLQAKGIVCRTITDAYCRLNSKSWNTPENAELVKDAEDCVAIFLNHYHFIYRNAGEKVIMTGLEDLRDRLVKVGDFDTEKVVPFDAWVESLL